MGDEKSMIVMASRDRESRDRELLIPTFYKVFRSWASKKFMTGW
ncbi:hypothetical protein Goklo_005931 [Gossypium klotzschianum]|nr:hypothetical protein [Gossypium klotzschianum]